MQIRYRDTRQIALQYCDISVFPNLDAAYIVFLEGRIRRIQRIALHGARDNVYYGIRISSTPAAGIADQGALKNVIRENHMSELYIMEPDEFSDSKIDGENFTGSDGKSRTAHIWLGRKSRGTIVEMMDDETYIDEGIDNVIEKKSE